jgi:hypothetical protein
MRLFVVVLALAVAASTQAMAFGSHGRMTKKAEVNEGCPAAFYRGSGGNCVHNPDYPKPYRPTRTGRRATTRLVRNILRAVAAISNGAREGWRRVHQRQAARDEERPTEADAPIKLSASLNRYGYFSLQLSSKHTGSG